MDNATAVSHNVSSHLEYTINSVLSVVLVARGLIIEGDWALSRWINHCASHIIYITYITCKIIHILRNYTILHAV